jgi:hypothetical protein
MFDISMQELLDINDRSTLPHLFVLACLQQNQIENWTIPSIFIMFQITNLV